MDASSSASGNGFDAALKALEDLDTTVSHNHEEEPADPAAPFIKPSSAIGFSDVESVDEPAAITVVPATEVTDPPFGRPASGETPEHLQHPADGSAAKAEAAPRPRLAASRFGNLAIGLALFSSMVSAAGLVVAERTIMSAQLVVADARERQRQLEQANKLISDLELVRDKQIELLQAQQAQLAATPVTSTELQQKMDILQTGLLARDPLNGVITAIHEGQSNTNARFNEFGMKIARLEAAIGGRH